MPAIPPTTEIGVDELEALRRRDRVREETLRLLIEHQHLDPERLAQAETFARTFILRQEDSHADR